MAELFFYFLSHDCRFAVRTYGDYLDRDSEVLLHECYVVAEFLWKFLFCAAVGEICMSSLELCVDRLYVSICVEWPLVGRFSVNDV